MVQRIALNICCSILGSAQLRTRVRRVAVVDCSLCFGSVSVPLEHFDSHRTRFREIFCWDFTKICRESSGLIKIGQKITGSLRNTYIFSIVTMVAVSSNRQL